MKKMMVSITSDCNVNYIRSKLYFQREKYFLKFSFERAYIQEIVFEREKRPLINIFKRYSFNKLALRSWKHTCSEICLHIRGSVCMKSEQVLFSFDLVALRDLRWLGSLASLLYLWPGVSRSPFQGATFGFGSFWLGTVLGGSSGKAEFWILSIHSITSLLVMPHPPPSPEKKIIYISII